MKSYHQPNDKTLDIELKDNIKFQNGQKLTAEKVKSSLENSMKKRLGQIFITNIINYR